MRTHSCAVDNLVNTEQVEEPTCPRKRQHSDVDDDEDEPAPLEREPTMLEPRALDMDQPAGEEASEEEDPPTQVYPPEQEEEPAPQQEEGELVQPTPDTEPSPPSPSPAAG